MASEYMLYFAIFAAFKESVTLNGTMTLILPFWYHSKAHIGLHISIRGPSGQ